MSHAALLDKIQQQPESVSFAEVIQVIEENYHYTPTSFTNGSLQNEASTNEGSCKIFCFAKLNSLTEAQTLACFGHYYRDDVLGNPKGDDHGNIRNFMQTGWSGVHFNTVPLTLSS